MRILIVGAGIMGLATAWALQRQGDVTVEVFEQGPIPQPLGSSNDHHRLIRHPYGQEPGYVRLVTAAFGAWKQLFADLASPARRSPDAAAGSVGGTHLLGAPWYHQTGTLGLAVPGASWVSESADTLDTVGIPWDRLEPAELARRFPYLHLERVDWGMWLPGGGALMAKNIVCDLARWLRRAGVLLHTGQEVLEVDPVGAGAGPRLRVQDQWHDADAIVVAAGPWLPRLLPQMADRVTPSRQVVVYARPAPHLAAAWSTGPMVLDIGVDTGFYSVPPLPGSAGPGSAGAGAAGGSSAAGLLKIGDHRFSLEGQPEDRREVSPAEARAIFSLCAERFCDFDQFELVDARSCYYTVQPEERFIAEPLGDGPAWVLGGFSGHGFKFGALMGLRMAEVLRGKREGAAFTREAAGR